ncbi:MAG: ATP-dependent DNA helicase RecG [Candidatus Ozemobacter sibiricus]|uniref:Probable DNA 3'-5' helicase RecG n=1 Tax=Candidatus Ozemobacter sibiricus TaxID=2268124 RepID=A0A367ZQG5_9BACT|nr:MAG: ATP-dependent DNA helicase RecG [Candidatus Ozemobacter sibiricus]
MRRRPRAPRPHLFSAIPAIPGVGPKRAAALAAAGYTRVLDLLRFLPRRYEDRTALRPLAALRPDRDGQGVFRARLTALKLQRPRGGLVIVWALFRDASGEARARWFNQPYLARSLVVGREYFLFGPGTEIKDIPVLDNPEWDPVDPPDQATPADPTDSAAPAEPALQATPPDPSASPAAATLAEPAAPSRSSPVAGALTPIYPSSAALAKARLSPRTVRRLIAHLLITLDWEASFPTLAPDSPFPRLRQAILDAHWPRDLAAAARARETFSFFDQVLFQIGVLRRRERLTGTLSLPRESGETPPSESPFPLPFALTADQKRALGVILADLATPDGRPMNRLLQGDVGSGKTVVAFLAMRLFASQIRPGAQTAFMAPTEILATQQHAAFLRFFPEEAPQTGLLTGSRRPQERQELLAALRAGRLRHLFGTHALFQDEVAFAALGFVVIDEQQRFGVDHRRALVAKGSREGSPCPERASEGTTPPHGPHLLALSATPIPRSLALTIFGDMDVTALRDAPPGRVPVQTQILPGWQAALPALHAHLAAGGQAFFICPVIEPSTRSDRRSVAEALLKLGKALPDVPLAAVSGQRPPAENLATLRRFRAGEIRLLIATTMVEVGIDHPDATLMIIEDAHRFGLSQLHQLRGRVGRGHRPGTCLLISPQTESERLAILTRTTDGFVIAQEDLRLRGPGDLVGRHQSGLSHPAFAHALAPELIERARRRAFDLLTREPPPIRDWFLARTAESFGPAFDTFMDGG